MWKCSNDKVDEMSPAPPPNPPPLLNPLPQPPCPGPPGSPHRRQGGQGRIGDITSKGLRTAVALSTAACSDSCCPSSFERSCSWRTVSWPGAQVRFLCLPACNDHHGQRHSWGVCWGVVSPPPPIHTLCTSARCTQFYDILHANRVETHLQPQSCVERLV